MSILIYLVGFFISYIITLYDQLDKRSVKTHPSKGTSNYSYMHKQSTILSVFWMFTFVVIFVDVIILVYRDYKESREES